jgi:Major Facilitator Superfamily
MPSGKHADVVLQRNGRKCTYDRLDIIDELFLLGQRAVRANSRGQRLTIHPKEQEMSVASTPRLAPRSASSSPASSSPSQELKFSFVLAWLLCAIFYFYQYAVRSAPGVMQEELTAAWGGNYIGTLIAAYYVAYALMALIAGVLLDRYGARHTIPLRIAVVGVGCVIFAQGSEAAGMTGFVLQALGAIFAFIGSSYVVARYLPARMLAIFLGFTQCLGMAGQRSGQSPSTWRSTLPAVFMLPGNPYGSPSR